MKFHITSLPFILGVVEAVNQMNALEHAAAALVNRKPEPIMGSLVSSPIDAIRDFIEIRADGNNTSVTTGKSTSSSQPDSTSTSPNTSFLSSSPSSSSDDDEITTTTTTSVTEATTTHLKTTASNTKSSSSSTTTTSAHKKQLEAKTETPTSTALAKLHLEAAAETATTVLWYTPLGWSISYEHLDPTAAGDGPDATATDAEGKPIAPTESPEGGATSTDLSRFALIIAITALLLLHNDRR